MSLRTPLLLLVAAIIPAPNEVSLSGRNWSIGFPFGYLDYRSDFPDLNFGGVLNFYFLALVVDVSLMIVAAWIINRIATRYFKVQETLAFSLLSICLITIGYGVRPSTFNAVDSLLAVRPFVAVVLTAFGTLITAGCAVALFFIRRKEDRGGEPRREFPTSGSP